MAKVKGNSFEAREKKNKKRSSIVKMSELRAEVFEPVQEPKEEPKVQEVNKVNEKPVEVKPVEVKPAEPKEEVKPEVKVEAKEEPKAEPVAEKVEIPKIVAEITSKEVKNLNSEEVKKPVNYKTFEVVTEVIDAEAQVQEANGDDATASAINDFFNLNVKNDVFEGKMTTVRVYDDILDTLKSYASMKNYPIIEFTNKVITLGLDDFASFGVLEISEIKLKNNTSRSIMYNLTDVMEAKLNNYIEELNAKGYKVSRNVILNVILNETLKKFYVK